MITSFLPPQKKEVPLSLLGTELAPTSFLPSHPLIPGIGGISSFSTSVGSPQVLPQSLIVSPSYSYQSKIQQPVVLINQSSAFQTKLIQKPIVQQLIIQHSEIMGHIRGYSEIEYIPFSKQYYEQVPVEKIEYVSIEKRYIDYYVIENQVEYVPYSTYSTVREIFPQTRTEYVAEERVEHVPQEYTEYVPVQRVKEFFEYQPVERTIVHYPEYDRQFALEAESSGRIKRNLTGVPCTFIDQARDSLILSQNIKNIAPPASYVESQQLDVAKNAFLQNPSPTVPLAVSQQYDVIIPNHSIVVNQETSAPYIIGKPNEISPPKFIVEEQQDAFLHNVEPNASAPLNIDSQEKLNISKPDTVGDVKLPDWYIRASKICDTLVSQIPEIKPDEIEKFKSEYCSNIYLHPGDPDFDERLKDWIQIMFQRWDWLQANKETYVNMLRVCGFNDENIQDCLDGKRSLSFKTREIHQEFCKDLKKLKKAIESETPFRNVFFVVTGSSVPGFSQNPHKGLRERPSKITNPDKSDTDIVVVAKGIKKFVENKIKQIPDLKYREYPSACTREGEKSLRIGFKHNSDVAACIETFVAKWRKKLGGGIQMTYQEDENIILPPWELPVLFYQYDL